MKVYLAMYCPMTEESAYSTLSIHLSREGAENAIISHKADILNEWHSYSDLFKKNYPFDFMQDWKIAETEVKP